MSGGGVGGCEVRGEGVRGWWCEGSRCMWSVAVSVAVPHGHNRVSEEFPGRGRNRCSVVTETTSWNPSHLLYQRVSLVPRPCPAFVTCSTEKWGEHGIFSHVSMT